MKTTAFACLLFLLALACKGPEMPANSNELPATWPYGVTYEVFVHSFCDSNGDGIGDLNGLTSRLDYIQDLGAEAIWLMPVNPSPSYHKYDVTDYYGIHPDYGTMDDFKKLLDEAHQRGIKVVMDLVINHCSSSHPWFKDALNPDSEYHDYFVWATMDEIKQEGNLLKEQTGDSDNIRQWNEVTGGDEYYFSFFWSGMPDLNFDNPKVREEIYKIGAFWLKDIGVDGFRLDAAKHIYPDHRAEDNHAFWQEFKNKMTAVRPDAYLVGEVWSDLPTQAPFAAGFSSLFNFDLAFSIMETVKNGRNLKASIFEHAWKVTEEGNVIELFNEGEKSFQKYNPDFINATFLTNHDQNRAMSFLANDPDKARLAASILLTLPGMPYLYYGEELGMRGMKPDELIREPMLWSAEPDSSETTWIKAEYSTRETVTPAGAQVADENSMYHHYRKLIRFRRSSPVMTRGQVALVDYGDDEILAYRREKEGQSLLVIHNLSAQPKAVKNDRDFGKNLLVTSPGVKQEANVLTLPPHSSIILENP